jgi:AraC-like DNA-binding protein
MNHSYQRPNSSLSAYVRTVLVEDGSASPDPDQLPVFTNAMPALFCRFDANNAIRLQLYGGSIPGDSEPVTPATLILIYFFNPFVIAPLFGIPAAKLAKKPLDLQNWNGQKTIALRTQLIYASTLSERINILDKLLLYLAEENKKELLIIQYATDRILCEPGTEILTEIVDHLAITERTFQRIFKKYTGITPSQYRRICQFQLSFSQLKSGDFDKLTDIAYDNGFADQSHFNRSFREFTNITPNQYLRSGLDKKSE